MPRAPVQVAIICLTLILIFGSNPPALAQSPLPAPEVTYLNSWPVDLRPNDIATNPQNGDLAVVDAGNTSIQILRRGGGLRTFREGFQDPRCVSYLPDGTLLVGEAEPGRVRGYDENGGVSLTLGNPVGEFLTPNDIAVHPSTGRIYVVDSAANAVKVYGQSDGVLDFQFGVVGTGPGELRFPISIAVSGSLNEVFVGDSRNRRIAVFDSETGAFKRNIGGPGNDVGEISFVGGMQIDEDLRLFVVESLGGFVYILDTDGGLVGQIGEHGTGYGQLRSPKSLVIDQYNRLLVSSFMDSKIEVWGLDSFRNPGDKGILAVAKPVPRHLKKLGGQRLRVMIEVEGIQPADLDPVQIRINGSVRPDRDTFRTGPHLAVYFPTKEILATLPPGHLGETVLQLTGVTRRGVKFQSDINVDVVMFVPPDPRIRPRAKP